MTDDDMAAFEQKATEYGLRADERADAMRWFLLGRKSAAVAPVTDERAAFEKWANLSNRQAWKLNDGETYLYADIQMQWETWQARANLA